MEISIENKFKNEIQVNDLVVVCSDEHTTVYGIVVYQDERYNVVVLGEESPLFENLYLNEEQPISYADLQNEYKLARKDNAYRVILEM